MARAPMVRSMFFLRVSRRVVILLRRGDYIGHFQDIKNFVKIEKRWITTPPRKTRVRSPETPRKKRVRSPETLRKTRRCIYF